MIELRHFCANEGSRSQPFSRREWTYASDGVITIRVPLIPWIEQNDTIAPLTEEVFTKAFVIPSLPMHLPALNEQAMKKCEKCGRIHVSAGIGKAVFDFKYINLIWDQLSMVRWPLPRDARFPVFFTFDGGQGCLMPLMAAHENHIVMYPVGDESPLPA